MLPKGSDLGKHPVSAATRLDIDENTLVLVFALASCVYIFAVCMLGSFSFFCVPVQLAVLSKASSALWFILDFFDRLQELWDAQAYWCPALRIKGPAILVAFVDVSDGEQTTCRRHITMCSPKKEAANSGYWRCVSWSASACIDEWLWIFVVWLCFRTADRPLFLAGLSHERQSCVSMWPQGWRSHCQPKQAQQGLEIDEFQRDKRTFAAHFALAHAIETAHLLWWRVCVGVYHLDRCKMWNFFFSISVLMRGHRRPIELCPTKALYGVFRISAIPLSQSCFPRWQPDSVSYWLV